jgi:hypothetical protein
MLLYNMVLGSHYYRMKQSALILEQSHSSTQAGTLWIRTTSEVLSIFQKYRMRYFLKMLHRIEVSHRTNRTIHHQT